MFAELLQSVEQYFVGTNGAWLCILARVFLQVNMTYKSG